MASLFTHSLIPVALRLSSAGAAFPKRLLAVCVFLAVLPDFDVVAFRFGIPYESQWGHRGFTHSIAFALACALVCRWFHRGLGSTPKTVLWATFVATLSHTVLDALTNGGLGVAAFWPLDQSRYFFPVRPIQVSPIGVANFFGPRGLVVILSELLWVWAPVLTLSFIIRQARRRRRR